MVRQVVKYFLKSRECDQTHSFSLIEKIEILKVPECQLMKKSFLLILMK